MIGLDDLLVRFGERELAERTDRENASEIDFDVVQRAIDDAVAEAESYVRAAGIMRLSQPSPALKGYVCDIARWRIYDDAASEIVEQRYKLAIEWLKFASKHPAMLDDTLAVLTSEERNRTGCAVEPNKPPDWSDYAA